MLDPIPERLELWAKETVDAALAVHKGLGPGLLESVYEKCLLYELRTRNLCVECQVPLPIKYKALVLDDSLRLDLLVGGELVVEIKAVEKLIPLHTAQLITYLKLADMRLGLLINFNVRYLKDGLHRVAL